VARRRRVMRSVRRKGDLVWVTTVIAASLLEATPTDYGLLVISTDWGSQTGFDRCTLMGIRGWLHWAQNAAATSGEATGFYTAIYVTDQSVPLNSMDASTATEYQDFDTIWTGGQALNQTTGTSSPQPTTFLDIKSRRKLTSASNVRLAGTVDGDTATPRVSINGVVRTLLKLDAA